MIIRQRVLPRFANDIGIWKGSIVYEVLYPAFEVKAIVGFDGDKYKCYSSLFGHPKHKRKLYQLVQEREDIKTRT